MWLVEFVRDMARLVLETLVYLLLIAAIVGVIYVLGHAEDRPQYHSTPYATPTAESVRYG